MRVSTYPVTLAHNSNTGHITPCKIYYFFWPVPRAIIHIMPMSFCNDIANIEELCNFLDFSQ